MALFCFHFAKEGSTFSAIANFVTLKSPFTFRHVQFMEVFCCNLRNSASSPLISAAPTNMPLLLSDSHSASVVLSSSPCSLLSPIFLHMWLEFTTFFTFSVVTLQWLSAHSFILGIDITNELARRGALYFSRLMSLVVYPQQTLIMWK